MRLIFIFLSIIISQSYARDNPLFKIISYSEGVLLDGIPVKPGQFVYSTSVMLEIPKPGYVGVITYEGFVYTLRKNVKVNSVNKKGKYRKEDQNRIFHTGTVYAHPPIVGFEGSLENARHGVYGDSLFFAIFDKSNSGPPYMVTFVNLFDEITYQDTIGKNWKIYSLSELRKEEQAIMFTIKPLSPQPQFYYAEINHILKVMDVKSKHFLETNLNRLEGQDAAAIAAFYEMNDLFYDQLFQLYRIEKEKPALDVISKAYFSRMREKYNFDQYNLLNVN